jgi:hypothetical protein
VAARDSSHRAGSGYLIVYQSPDWNRRRDDFAGQGGVAMDDIQIVRITRWSRDIELRDSLVVSRVENRCGELRCVKTNDATQGVMHFSLVKWKYVDRARLIAWFG